MVTDVKEHRKKVFLLGAGASQATLGCEHAPTSRGFGKVLLAKFPNWSEHLPFLYEALGYLREQSRVDVSDWILHEAWNGIDENYKLRRVLRNPEPPWPTRIPKERNLYSQYKHPYWDSFWTLAGWELRKALTWVYGIELEAVIRDASLQSKWIFNQVQEQNPGTIVTTNYDLMVEAMIVARNSITKRDFRNAEKANRPFLTSMMRYSLASGQPCRPCSRGEKDATDRLISFGQNHT